MLKLRKEYGVINCLICVIVCADFTFMMCLNKENKKVKVLFHNNNRAMGFSSYLTGYRTQ
jgi:hypothetical protein